MKNTLLKYLEIKGLNKIIYEICKYCDACNREKEFTHNFGITTNEVNTTKINEVVGLDIKGPIKTSHFKGKEGGNYFYILVMVDIYSRYAEIDIINDIKSETICDSFENNWIKKHKAPNKCLSDNGRQFISMNFQKLLSKYSIQQINTAPSNPTGNGIVERLNLEIGLVLRLSRGTDLKTLKNNILRRINCTCNKTLGFSPIEIFSRLSIFKNQKSRIIIKDSEIKNKLKLSCDKNNEKVKNARIKVNYKEGDLVYVKNNSQDKVDKKWLGPFKVKRNSKSKNNIFIEERNKIWRVSIKNCRPASVGRM